MESHIMIEQLDIDDEMFSPLNIAIADFLATTACDVGDLLPTCAGDVWNDTLREWIDELDDDSPSALQPDALLQALIAAERLLAYCLRMTTASPPPAALLDQVREQLRLEPDVHGVQIAIRVLLNIRILTSLAQLEKAEKLVNEALSFDLGEVQRLMTTLADLEGMA